MDKPNLIEVSMVITRANLKDGVMRWQAVTSDTLPDNTGESTSLALFQDWIERIETGKTVDWLPPPRKPFLGVSHYSDLSGFGEAGIAEKGYVDGNRFRASGVFRQETPIGPAVFQTLKSELETPSDKPIRISAAWWDIAHSHGSFIFERKSLTDVCPMCAKGVGSKVYLKGQLDHYATTRVPINPRTSLALTERAMTTRKEDAVTIIGEDLAEELEEKSKLIGKSETESPAIVVKANGKYKADDEEEEEESEEEEMEEKPKGKKKPAGAATHGTQAKGGSFMADSPAVAAQAAVTWESAKVLPQAKSLSRVELMGLVRRNIAGQPEEERLGMLEALLDDMDSELTEIKTAVEEMYFAQPAVEDDLLPDDDYGEEEETPMTNYLETFAQEVTEALESNQPATAKAETIQKSLNTVALAIKAELEAPAGGGDMAVALRAALAPITDQIAQLTARLNMQQQPQIVMPVQKSITAPAMNPMQPQTSLPVSPVTGQPSSLTALVRGSVGL